MAHMNREAGQVNPARTWRGQHRAIAASNDVGCVMAGLYVGARIDIPARGKVNCGVIRCIPAIA
jgi:hypothetical protein